MIRVLLVDDHAFVRASVSHLLRQARGIEVVGECEDGSEVLGLAGTTRPDVVLMDVQMPVMDGMAATRSLLSRRPEVRVLMLAGSVDGSVLDEAERAGASGYLLKDGDPRVLVSGIRRVAAGGSLWAGGDPLF